MITRQRAQCSKLSPSLPDELWALVLSKCSWEGAWRAVLPLLLWRRGAAAALRGRPDLLAELLHGQGERARPLTKAATEGQAGVVGRLLRLDGIAAGEEGGHGDLGAAAGADTPRNAANSRYLRPVENDGDVAELQVAIVGASRNGHAAVVAQLLPHCQGPKRRAACFQALLGAALAGHMPVVGQLLALDVCTMAPFNQLSSAGRNIRNDLPFIRAAQDTGMLYFALKIAASAGCTDAVRRLLAAMPSTPLDWQHMKQPLQMAAACDRVEVVQTLLQHSKGAPAYVVERLLRVPAIRGNAAMVRLLMDDSVRTRSDRRRFQAVLE